MDSPFFSIIVVSYQAEGTIARTIESVLSQSFDDYEIVVKDGASTDNTLARVPTSPKIRVYSERDRGIYDAMNVAVQYSRGRYLCFLNCGDYFADADVLKTVYECAEKLKEESVIYGDYTKLGVHAKQPSTLTAFKIYSNALCHQTMFFHRSVFEKFGLYDTDMKISADYGITVKSFVGGMNYVHVPCVICDYEGNGVSESTEGIKLREAERKRIVKKYFTSAQRAKFEFVLFFTARPLRRLISSNRSPLWMRKLYRKVVNRVKGR